MGFPGYIERSIVSSEIRINNSHINIVNVILTLLDNETIFWKKLMCLLFSNSNVANRKTMFTTTLKKLEMSSVGFMNVTKKDVETFTKEKIPRIFRVVKMILVFFIPFITKIGKIKYSIKSEIKYQG